MMLTKFGVFVFFDQFGIFGKKIGNFSARVCWFFFRLPCGSY